ncbi:MAG TPA: NADPH-dependent FMN reductase [Vitreimonas sp.]|jgi:chromate reductase|nr:NADPH-dependent FMN reductase [Vitreimonas sp.]
MTKVAVIVGSLKKTSLNRQFVLALAKLARPKLDLKIVEIGDLPFYSEDAEKELPAAVTRFKSEIESADAVLFVTPEYLRAIPGVLKNAIEWGARPYGKNSWGGKPGAVAGVTPGAIGTAVAQSQLRSIAPVLDIALISQPELYLSLKPGQIAENGDVADETLKALLTTFVDRFSAWIARLEQKPALQF